MADSIVYTFGSLVEISLGASVGLCIGMCQGMPATRRQSFFPLKSSAISSIHQFHSAKMAAETVLAECLVELGIPGVLDR